MIVLAAILIYFAGVLHGLREAFHADRKIFERLLKVQAVSFFGSQQDRLKYNSIGDYKSVWWRYFPQDFWHISRWLENFAVAGTIFALTGNWWVVVSYVTIIVTAGHLSYWFLKRK